MSEPITPDSLTVLSPNRGGRPRATVQLSPVSTRIPTEVHDRIARIALEKGESVSATVRTLLSSLTLK